MKTRLKVFYTLNRSSVGGCCSVLTATQGAPKLLFRLVGDRRTFCFIKTLFFDAMTDRIQTNDYGVIHKPCGNGGGCQMFMLLHKPYLVKLSTKGEVVKIVHIFYKGSLLTEHLHRLLFFAI